jgi:hypothetical protein
MYGKRVESELLLSRIISLCCIRNIEFSGPLRGFGVGAEAPPSRCGYMLQKQRRVKLENPLRVSPSLSLPFSPHSTSHHLDGCLFFSAVSRPSVVDQKKEFCYVLKGEL